MQPSTQPIEVPPPVQPWVATVGTTIVLRTQHRDNHRGAVRYSHLFGHHRNQATSPLLIALVATSKSAVGSAPTTAAHPTVDATIDSAIASALTPTLWTTVSTPYGTPISQPSTQPSTPPSCQPRRVASRQPRCQPSSQPSSQPSRQPSPRTSAQPSLQPYSGSSRVVTRTPFHKKRASTTRPVPAASTELCTSRDPASVPSSFPLHARPLSGRTWHAA